MKEMSDLIWAFTYGLFMGMGIAFMVVYIVIDYRERRNKRR